MPINVIPATVSVTKQNPIPRADTAASNTNRSLPSQVMNAAATNQPARPTPVAGTDTTHILPTRSTVQQQAMAAPAESTNSAIAHYPGIVASSYALRDDQSAQSLGNAVVRLYQDTVFEGCRLMDTNANWAAILRINAAIDALPSSEIANAPYLATYRAASNRHIMSTFRDPPNQQLEHNDIQALANWQGDAITAIRDHLRNNGTSTLPAGLNNYGLNEYRHDEAVGGRVTQIASSVCTLAVVGMVDYSPSSYTGPVVHMLKADSSPESRENIIAQLPLSDDQATWIRTVDVENPSTFPGAVR